MVELLHQATRAERQVREDLASAKTKTFFAARNATNTSKASSRINKLCPPKLPRDLVTSLASSVGLKDINPLNARTQEL
jgi:hypothetical protein